MSFFKNSLRALGFGKDDDNDDRTFTAKDIVNATANNPVNTDKSTPAATTPADNCDNNNDNNNTALPHTLLDKMVELINASFPDFIRNCIDTESEKKYIYEQLGDSFQQYITELNQSALSQSQANVASARKQLETEMETLRRKATELEEQKVESKNAQLSAERQKRALSEKVHELDNRIATLEAEKEQYDLENKSLINKLKVSGVKQQELDDAQEEINRLLGVIQDLKKNSVIPEETVAELNDKNAAIEALQERISYLTTEKEELATGMTTLNNERDTLAKTITEKENIIAQLTDEIASMVTQQDNSAREIAELNTAKEAAAMLQTSLEEVRKQYTALEAQVESATAEKNNTIEQLQQQLTALQAQLDSTTGQLTSATEQLSHSELKAQENNTSLNERIDDLSLQLNVATNNYNQAAEQLEASIEENTLLQENIKQLQQQIVELGAANDAQQAAQGIIANLQEEASLLQGQLTQLRDENTSLQSQVAQGNEDNKQQQERISALNNDISALNNSNNTLQQEADSLQEQLRKAQQQLAEAQEQAAQAREQLAEAREEARNNASQAASVAVDSQELERANNMIAALKKQRQDLVSQTATLRSQNKAYENQIAILESKLNNATNDDNFENVTDLDDALNWMMPIVPDTLEEEARRREEEEKLRREEEERERQAEKERQAARDNSSQMSLW